MGTQSPYVSVAAAAAAKYGVPTAIFQSVIQQESGFNPNPTPNQNSNGTTDYGIAQLNSAYYPNAATMSPEQQLDTAAQTLSQNFARTGNWFDAVKAYNGSGPAATTYANTVLGNAENLDPSTLGTALTGVGSSLSSDLVGGGELAAGFASLNPALIGAGISSILGGGSSGKPSIIDQFIAWVEKLFSANTAARVVAVIVGIVLIAIALAYLTGTDKAVTQVVTTTAKNVGKAAALAA